MTDKLLAVISIAGVISFTLIVTTFVKELDLWLVVIAVLAMAVYDFVDTLRSNGGKPGA